MTLYDGCSAVGPSQPFPEFDPDFQDTDFVGLLRDLTSSQSIFQVICAHYTSVICLGRKSKKVPRR